jgi:biopolymer transport protein ExbB
MFEHFDWIGALRGSPVMVVLAVCSVWTFGFAIERLAYFWRRRGHPDRMLASALDHVRAGQLREAAWACRTGDHPFGAVAAEVIRNANMPAEVQEEKLQIALSDARMQMEKNLGVIGTMGNVAPLIGLLGTVWGIMRAFHDMANTGSAGPSVVAAGVAEALLTTGAGLVVAVPAVMLYNHFVRKIGVTLTVTENHARTLRLALSHGEAADAGRGTPPTERGTVEDPRIALAPAAARAA